ncbi:hypothetical protein Rhal01_02858 [Rubritalea halochordaticola]|uniref:O-antigen ligase domain-containing protein n=1 Tax=Rubritalea halochordaticola TaxID=714537 RepID=A0ABP9V1V9_9BACT
MNNTVKLIIFTVIAIIMAIYVGMGIATSQFQTALQVLGVGVILICIVLGRNIWMLIPFTFAIGLNLSIPGNPSTLLLGQVLFVGFGCMIFAMRSSLFHFRLTEIELLMGLLTVMVVQVYVRNPVGFSIFGTESIGGKAYIIYGITLLCAILLSGIKILPKDLKHFVKITIIGGVINFIIGVIGYFVPIVAMYTGNFHQKSAELEFHYYDPNAATRMEFIRNTGPNIALWVSSFVNPLKACFKILWAPLILFSFAAAGLSGYRNVVVTVGLTYLIGICYRGGIKSLLASLMLLVLTLTSLTVINMAVPLPANIQRSLSWLPGSWEEQYVDDAEESTNWRIEIWEEVLLTDNWIENKILGDGLGYTATELARQQNFRTYVGGMGLSGFDLHRETILVNGDYHSGPVSAIRVIGYVGLALMLFMMLRLCVHTHRLIKRCRNTEWFPLALMVGIPLIVFPIFFIFVYGSFQDDAATLLLGCGLIRMLENNIPYPRPEGESSDSEEEPVLL